LGSLFRSDAAGEADQIPSMSQMRKAFYLGLVGLAMFEILDVYFIMPMPGSQRIDSLSVAYFLYSHRWIFRAGFALVIAAGIRGIFQEGGKWLPTFAVVATFAVVWFLNFQMTAERMFRQPAKLVLKTRKESSVGEDSLIIGIELGGEAKAYPVRFLVYHHQVQDSIGGIPIIVTYCSVCRTGRVFKPIVAGRLEKFRLVGMDHFNAMFEDASTHSWWRQATGEAVIGPSRGSTLPEIDARQFLLREWFKLHLSSLVMQPDEASKAEYDPKGKFERGESTGRLTRTEFASWKDNSWVVGIRIGSVSKAYDWNRLKAQRVVNDRIGNVPVVLALAADQESFVSFERPDDGWIFTINGDSLSANGRSFDFSGKDLAEPTQHLKYVISHQEYWHSWRAFHPNTLRGQ
jgi:hypothetical protein